MTTTPGTTDRDPSHRAHLAHVLEHWGHLLPGQGPIATFVHHNTLHGLQHEPFERAVAEGERLLGGRGYDSVELGRARYRAGRINDADLEAVFASRPDLGVVEVLGTVGGRTVSDHEIRKLHILYGAAAVPPGVQRNAMTSQDAGRRLAADVPDAARARLLERSREELATGLERIGAEWTLADWFGALLNLEVPAAVLGEVAARQTAEATTASDSVQRLLDTLGIPPNRQAAYLAAVDAHCDRLPVAIRDDQRNRRLWLEAEARIAQGLARRHFGTRGTLPALEAEVLQDLEGYAVTALWQASLAAFSLADPYGPTTPATLTGRDPAAVAEQVVERFAEIERGGGPPVLLSASLRAAVRAAASDAIEMSERAAARDDADLDRAQREAVYAAWFVLADTEPAGLTRRATDALYHLARHLGDRDVGDLTTVAAAVARCDPRRRLSAHLEAVVGDQLDRIGADRTHAELVTSLVDEDIVERVNRYLIRRCAAFLDLGQAAWRMPDRAAGFYEAWRRAAPHDQALDMDGLRGWREAAAALPEHPADAVAVLLSRLGVEERQWESYVGRVLTGLPGWAGAMNWRGTNPQFPRQRTQPADLTQYLAVRLFVEVQLVTHVTRRTWNVEPAGLVAHLRARPHEMWMRSQALSGALPPDLTRSVRELAAGGADADWSLLADKAWAYYEQRHGVGSRFVANDHACRLFRLAQLQGWSAADVRALSVAVRDRLLAVLDDFPESAHRPIWLNAFEHHYRQQILGALAANRGRGRWRGRPKRPKAQIVLCIDEREESLHRAIDEFDPGYETFGAGGFFGIAMHYQGLDDHGVTPLCPANVTPANRVEEIPRPEALSVAARRSALRAWEEVFHNTYWETKRNAVSAFFLTQLTGLVQAVPLAGRVSVPWRWAKLVEATRGRLIPRPATRLTLDQDDHNRGFKTIEQADKVEAQLRNIGMTHHFARLVLFCGHGSLSVNNPHESAHDCGACGGKHGGPNGRAFAALANRRAVRTLLRERGIDIPDDTHFVGGIHNTASDEMAYFDTLDIPESHAAEWKALRADLDEASARSARERCRRFASAPEDPTPAAGLRHVQGRSRDLSQVRPEWGHCTNAFAIVGRRANTQGAYFDRRGFVISYDATQDPTGAIIERILLAMGPVGAGINLEYYFSTVDNRVYGCDTKVPHNVSGLLGIMEGASSDLRTGLPRQMIEIHEAMRLLLIVEASLDVLGGIYGRQPAIAQLLDNEWVTLVAMDPEAGTFTRFVAGKGFVPWEERVPELPVVRTSHDYYRGKKDFLPPVLIEIQAPPRHEVNGP
jgi:uncharacterized protein YbcC (UPF0753/DUF2309 family)